MSEDPKPAHIDEVARGIRDEGWKCGPYGGPVEATRGTQNPQRMRELCQGAPPSYTRRPYPCPKPVGELALHLPPDLPGLRVRQRLVIEQARLEVTCSWPNGVRVDLECFVPPSPNVLVVRWKIDNWNATTVMGRKPPVWFSLYRWADPTIQQFAARFFADCRHGAFQGACVAQATPLPPPLVQQDGDLRFVEQRFPADPTFPDGLAKLCFGANPPEFGFGRPYQPQPATYDPAPWPAIGDGAFRWYFGQYPWMAMGRLRAGAFVAERDLPVFCSLVERWRRPNGLVWGMSVAEYGRAGAWTESLGVTAPLQEMMLQSWDGALRVFPAWPKGLDASFDNFRAEGAFLVSAAWSQGRVTRLQVLSERGVPCAIYAPWPEGITVQQATGQAVEVSTDPHGRMAFPTNAGEKYSLQPPAAPRG